MISILIFAKNHTLYIDLAGRFAAGVLSSRIRREGSGIMKQETANILLQDLENAVALGDEPLAGLIEKSYHTLNDHHDREHLNDSDLWSEEL